MSELFMRIFDNNVCIHTDNQFLIEDIMQTFSFFIHENNKLPIDIDISVEENTNDDYRIVYDGKISACAKVNVYPKVCDIIRRSLILKTNFFCFHAAAVEKDGKGYVFISTGNSGKSTLCMALMFSGYKVISDDTCWIDPHTGIIYPYPLAIGVRHKTLDLLPTLRNMAINTSFPGKMVLPVQEAWISKPLKPFAYFLWELDFTKSDFHTVEIDNRELVFNLLGHSFSYKYCFNKSETFNCLVDTTKECLCYRLQGNNLSLLPQFLEELAKR